MLRSECEDARAARVCAEKNGLETWFPNTISPCARMRGGLDIGTGREDAGIYRKTRISGPR